MAKIFKRKKIKNKGLVSKLKKEITAMRRLSSSENFARLVEVHETFDEVILIFLPFYGEKLKLDSLQTLEAKGVEQSLKLAKDLVEASYHLKLEGFNTLKLQECDIYWDKNCIDEINFKIAGLQILENIEKAEGERCLKESSAAIKENVRLIGILLGNSLIELKFLEEAELQESCDKNKRGEGLMSNKELIIDLLQKMLKADKRKRISIDEALHHLAFTQNAKNNSSISSTEITTISGEQSLIISDIFAWTQAQKSDISRRDIDFLDIRRKYHNKKIIDRFGYIQPKNNKKFEEDSLRVVETKDKQINLRVGSGHDSCDLKLSQFEPRVSKILNKIKGTCETRTTMNKGA